jgi:hypothetical protein
MNANDQAAARPRLCLARRRLLLGGGAAALLAGCAVAPRAPEGEWHDVPLPGKQPTRYAPEHKAGRAAVAARADASASLWRKRIDVPAHKLGEVSFSWWVAALNDEADVAQAERADAVARVLFGFDGDTSRLPLRTRMQFELVHTLTGEPPPYATLAYVWDTRAPLDAVVLNPRSDRMRKIVVDSGRAQLGRWRDHRRHLARDFRRAFGEDPGPLRSVALMTDADNTRASVRAWYGPVRIH